MIIQIVALYLVNNFGGIKPRYLQGCVAGKTQLSAASRHHGQRNRIYIKAASDDGMYITLFTEADGVMRDP